MNDYVAQYLKRLFRQEIYKPGYLLLNFNDDSAERQNQLKSGNGFSFLSKIHF